MEPDKSLLNLPGRCKKKLVLLADSFNQYIVFETQQSVDQIEFSFLKMFFNKNIRFDSNANPNLPKFIF